MLTLGAFGSLDVGIEPSSVVEDELNEFVDEFIMDFVSTEVSELVEDKLALAFASFIILFTSPVADTGNKVVWFFVISESVFTTKFSTFENMDSLGVFLSFVPIELFESANDSVFVFTGVEITSADTKLAASTTAGVFTAIDVAAGVFTATDVAAGVFTATDGLDDDALGGP